VSEDPGIVIRTKLYMVDQYRDNVHKLWLDRWGKLYSLCRTTNRAISDL